MILIGGHILVKTSEVFDILGRVTLYRCKKLNTFFYFHYEKTVEKDTVLNRVGIFLRRKFVVALTACRYSLDLDITICGEENKHR